MNKKLLLIAIFLISLNVCSQLKRPKKSFLQKTEQRIGLTTVKLEYYRPSMKGRIIFGELVKYNEIWRTGANRNSTITFDNDVEISNKKLSAGTYAIYTKPNKKSWDVFFYTDINNWGVPKEWDAQKVALKITVPTFKLNKDFETLTINIDNIKESSANLSILWERTYISIPIEFNFKKLLAETTQKELKRNITEFHIAAVNYQERNYNLEQAKTWMEQAISLREEPYFWDYREYSLILSKLQKYKEAIQAAEYCIELSTKLGDRGVNAINLSKKSIEEWKNKI